MTALLAALSLTTPVTVDEYAEKHLSCAPIEEWRPYAPREQRIEHRKRAMRACRRMGASVEACNVLDVIAMRESSGDACAVHTLGPKEYGLGIHALSVGMHLAKWDTYVDARHANVLRIPEVSTVVTMRIFRRAVVRYGADTWREVGGVFAGRKYENGEERLFCARLERVGIDCEDDPRGQLGDKLGREPTLDQDIFVIRLLAGELAKSKEGS